MFQASFIRRLTIAFAFGAAASPAWAQDEPAAPEAPRCSVITVAPGDSLDALFGHTAIRIKDRRLPHGDVWFDYGVFDPSDWTFWIHYAKGDAKYFLMAADPQGRLDWYAKEGRAAVEQELDLTREEAQKLEDFLIEDLRSGCGKDGYAYRFLDDNCTTRAKEMIEKATGEKLPGPNMWHRSYRRFTNGKLARNAWAQLGANLFMGSHAERPAKAFLPAHLCLALIPDWGDGSASRILVKDNKRAEEAMGRDYVTGDVQSFQSTLFITASFAFFTLFLCALPTFLRWKKRKPLPSRGWLDALLFGFIGWVGSLMAFLGAWSLHPELGAFNWNLIWCWPTHLLFAVGLVFLPRHRNLRLYARMTAIGAVLAACAYFFVPQALPIPLFPVVLLLGLRAARWGWGTEQNNNNQPRQIG